MGRSTGLRALEREKRAALDISEKKNGRERRQRPLMHKLFDEKSDDESGEENGTEREKLEEGMERDGRDGYKDPDTQESDRDIDQDGSKESDNNDDDDDDAPENISLSASKASNKKLRKELSRRSQEEAGIRGELRKKRRLVAAEGFKHSKLQSSTPARSEIGLSERADDEDRLHSGSVSIKNDLPEKLPQHLLDSYKRHIKFDQEGQEANLEDEGISKRKNMPSASSRRKQRRSKRTNHPHSRDVGGGIKVQYLPDLDNSHREKAADRVTHRRRSIVEEPQKQAINKARTTQKKALHQSMERHPTSSAYTMSGASSYVAKHLARAQSQAAKSGARRAERAGGGGQSSSLDYDAGPYLGRKTGIPAKSPKGSVVRDLSMVERRTGGGFGGRGLISATSFVQ